ncbi:MAG: YncE family protein [Deltaproteobacteria bacterium]|nr:YncE family protein [Deltaproteobacteria bacterium]
MATELAYVANELGSGISVIHTTTNALIDTIAVRPVPIEVATSPDGRMVYVTHVGGVSTIATATSSLVGEIPGDVFERLPGPIAFNRDGSRAYIVEPGFPDDSGFGFFLGREVAVIDTSVLALVTKIPVDVQPNDIVMAPDGTRAYVSNFRFGTISVIDINRNVVTDTIQLDHPPTRLTVTPDGRALYVAHFLSGGVGVVDIESATVTEFISLGVDVGRPTDVVVTPDGTTLYVVNATLPGTVSAIDTRTNVAFATIPVGDIPKQAAVTADGAYLYVTNSESDTVSSIDMRTNTVVATAAVGPSPRGIVIATLPPACAGDCDVDGVVTVDELVRGVRIALGRTSLASCLAMDPGGEGTVSVDELVRAVNHALGRCD